MNQKVYKEQEDSNNNMHPGDRNGSPDDPFHSVFVCIDSGFLSKLSKYLGGGKYLTYDLIKFSERLAEKQNLNCERVYYYTSPPFQSQPPSQEENVRKERHDRFIKKLSESNKIFVREGRCQKLLNNNGKEIYSQKAVDSLMVIDLMRLLIEHKEIKNVILIACDSDFVPVIEQLKEHDVKVILYTYFTKRRDTNFSRSNHLINSVSRYVLLTKEDFDRSPIST